MQHSKRFNFFTAISIVTICVLLFVNVGFVAMYHVSKMRWYHQQLEERENESTVTLRLTHEQFETCRVKEHEWKIDGEMYDARSFETDSNGVTMIAVHDEHENKLLEMLTAGFACDDEDENSLCDWVKIFSHPGLTESRFTIQIISFYTALQFSLDSISLQFYSASIERPPLA